MIEIFFQWTQSSCYFTGLHGPQQYWSERFILFSYWITIIILTAAYSGNLTASLAVKKTNMPFNSLRELADSKDYYLGVYDGDVIQGLLQVKKLFTIQTNFYPN